MAATRTLWSPLAEETVLPDLLAWQSAGVRGALVTLVAIDGTTPRPLGAQMAVAEDGRFAGYLSGGCLEDAVAVEAQRAIAARRNTTVRYGRGSPYLDITLPCGSGLDLYIDCAVPEALLAEAHALTAARRPFSLATELATGAKQITRLDAPAPSRLADGTFRRTYMPLVQAVIAGSGPSVAALGHMFLAAGLETVIATSRARTQAECEAIGLTCRPLDALDAFAFDAWTAGLLAFHDHDAEGPILHRLLASPCFYIGALGSKAAHAGRVAALERHYGNGDLAGRIRSPIGLIPGAKSRGLLAAGVLADVLATAKEAALIV